MQDHPPIEGGEETAAGRIDAPQAGALVAPGPSMVSGWAFLPSGPPARVDLAANGVALGRARVGTERIDVAEARGWPKATICGFQAVVDLSPCARDGQATITATAIGMRGEVFDLPAVDVRISEANSVDEDRTAEALAPPSGHACGFGVTRALVFTHDLGYGGAQLYLSELLVRLRERGAFEAVVVTPSDGPLREVLEAAGIVVHVTSPPALRGPAEYEGRMAELAAWARPQGFSVVLANTILAWTGGDLAERLGVPCVWAIHESYPLEVAWAVHFPPELPEPYVRRRVERALGSAVLVFEARATQRFYERHAAADPSRLLTIPYGIRLADIDARRSSLDVASERAGRGIPESATLLVCVATFDGRKAQSSLAHALRELVAEFPRAHLALVGDVPGRYSDAVHRYVAEAGLAGRVTIAPVAPDVLSWYAIADALVIASDIESLPRTILEAMAFGVPVMATAVFGIPELIEDGRTGWLFAERDAGALRDAMRRVLALSAEQRAGVGEAGRRLVREHHDSSRYAAAYHELIARLTAG